MGIPISTMEKTGISMAIIGGGIITLQNNESTREINGETQVFSAYSMFVGDLIAFFGAIGNIWFYKMNS